MRKATYTVSKNFPVSPREQIVIRDGQGRPVERWNVSLIQEHKNGTDVTFLQDGYRDAASV